MLDSLNTGEGNKIVAGKGGDKIQITETYVKTATVFSGLTEGVLPKIPY